MEGQYPYPYPCQRTYAPSAPTTVYPAGIQARPAAAAAPTAVLGPSYGASVGLDMGGQGGLQAQAPSNQAPPAVEEPLKVSMVVPEGATPGSKLQYTAPDGQELRLTVPEGVPPGSIMTLTQDPTTKQWKCMAEPSENSQEPEPPAPVQTPGAAATGACGGTVTGCNTYTTPVPNAQERVTTYVTHQAAPGVTAYTPGHQAQPISVPRHIVHQSMPVNLSYVPPVAPGQHSVTMAPGQVLGGIGPCGAPVVPAGAVPYYQGPCGPQMIVNAGQYRQLQGDQRPGYAPPPGAVVMEQRPSYTPPPVMVMEQRPSYTPPPQAMPAMPVAPQPPQGPGQPDQGGPLMGSTAGVQAQQVPPGAPTYAGAPPVGPGPQTAGAYEGPSITTLPGQQQQPPIGQQMPMMPGMMQPMAMSPHGMPMMHPSMGSAGVVQPMMPMMPLPPGHPQAMLPPGHPMAGLAGTQPVAGIGSMGAVGFAPPMYGMPMHGQPMPGQPMPGQPMPGQMMPNQMQGLAPGANGFVGGPPGVPSGMVMPGGGPPPLGGGPGQSAGSYPPQMMQQGLEGATHGPDGLPLREGNPMPGAMLQQ